MTNSDTSRSQIVGVELHIQGIVQGVGFRPFIYNLATQLHISGTVSNTGAGVFIQAVAQQEVLDHFVNRIENSPPPLSQIYSIDKKELAVDHHFSGFAIVESDSADQASTAIPPDIALCNDCLSELLDPADRRYHYPFINCTNCGPRFTITENIPYDRPKTSMKVFPMCSECETEYNDPANRRFHAQPNACSSCGPTVSFHDNSGNNLQPQDPVAHCVKAIVEEKVMAIRGLGGFHLCVNPFSLNAVETLRSRKNRPTKPLAIMVKDMETAHALAYINDREQAQLECPQHPIVLLTAKQDTGLAANLCPGITDIGIMLPYTPLHHLLFAQPGCPKALVMTSGNISGHPICISNETAADQLKNIADFYLFHNREILTRVDDSVVKQIEKDFRLFRRARGFSPAPIITSQQLPQVLGCGAGLKSTFSLGRDNHAFLSQHIGDLFNLESYEFYRESIDHHKKVFEIEPEVVVRDLHPDYLSSHYAEECSIPVIEVQHHHAHAVAVMAEHDLTEPALGIILDGTGYGTDGTIWGGELLLCGLTWFKRLGHLQKLALPGGDKAAMEPWRMGLSALYHSYSGDDFAGHLTSHLPSIPSEMKEMLVTMMKSDFNSPLTSSCGRLFDAISALMNIRSHCDYEGHAAIELEAMASQALTNRWKDDLRNSFHSSQPTFLHNGGDNWEIVSTELIKIVVDKLSKGFSVAQIALEFHFDLLRNVTYLAMQLAEEHKVKDIVLSGGCLQNKLLMEGFFTLLEEEGYQVYTGEKVPVNDGGISFGQIICGGLQYVSRDSHAGNQGSG